MAEYEKERMKRIEENYARMKAMGIDKKASSFMSAISSSQNRKKKCKKNVCLEENEEFMPFSTNEESGSSSRSDKGAQLYASQMKSNMASQHGQGTRRSGRGGQPREDGQRLDSIPLLSGHECDLVFPASDPSPTNLVTNEQSQEPEQELVNDTTYGIEEEIGDSMTRRKRGITCGKGARKIMKATKKRLSVEFNFETMRVISENASSFMYECGYILRNNCSLQYKEWRHVPNEVRLPLRHKLTTLFEIDVENSNVCKVIDSYMARVWRSHRADLHAYFKAIGGSEDPAKAKTTPHRDASKEDWDYLCDMWSETKYLQNVEKKVMARAKRKLDSRNGSKSTIRYHIESGLDLDSSCGQLETWRRTHWDEEKGWISTTAAAKYEDMMKLRKEHPVESMSDKSIIEAVLGRSSVRLHGWGRDPTSSSSTMGTTKKSRRLSYDDLVDELETVKGKCAMMEQALIDNNIMPPSSSKFEQSQCDTLEGAEEIDE